MKIIKCVAITLIMMSMFNADQLINANDMGCSVCGNDFLQAGFTPPSDDKNDKYGMPKGSYNQTCDTCSLSGIFLNCHCRKINGSWNEDANISTCPGREIHNANGDLVYDDNTMICNPKK